MISVKVYDKKELKLTPGKHNILIKKIIEDFAPRYAPGSILLYAGDTGKKFSYYDEKGIMDLNISLDSHGKMPDIVLYYKKKNWIFLIESVTSHGPIDAKRYIELEQIFSCSKADTVYVTA
ncbi:MAG: hypothetical protein LBU09_05775, partial [Endomicrobium sp.]|nr:hypothetical protein [Endomicrobium sp.]